MSWLSADMLILAVTGETGEAGTVGRVNGIPCSPASSAFQPETVCIHMRARWLLRNTPSPDTHNKYPKPSSPRFNSPKPAVSTFRSRLRTPQSILVTEQRFNNTRSEDYILHTIDLPPWYTARHSTSGRITLLKQHLTRQPPSRRASITRSRCCASR